MRFIPIVLVAIILTIVMPVSAAWLPGYNYRQEHVILGSDDGTLTDYQMLFIIHARDGVSVDNKIYLNDHLLDPWNDLRFTTSDGMSLMDYCILESNPNIATVWVKVPTISAGSSTPTLIYIYYGKADDSNNSSGDDTFIFWDGFDNTPITGKWDTDGVSTNIQGSILNLTGTGTPSYIETNEDYSINTTFNAKLAYPYESIGHFGYRNSGWWWISPEIYSAFYPDGSEYFTGTKNSDTPTVTNLGNASIGWHSWEVRRNGSNSNIFLIDNSVVATHTSDIPTDDMKIQITIHEGYSALCDWIFVRSFTPNEPTHSTYTPEEAATESLTLTISPDWIIANGLSTANISVQALIGTTPQPNLFVNLTLENSSLGDFSQSNGFTDSNGYFLSTFTANQKSGDTNVTAAVTFPTGIYTNKTPLHLDHGPAYNSTFFYESEVTVGSVTNITARITDKYGNPVDNRNAARFTGENVSFSLIGSPADEALFFNTSTEALVGVDHNGNATVMMNVSKTPGDHVIYINPQSSAPDATIIIRGLARGSPSVLEASVKPAVGYQPANCTQNFSITYYLFDEFGNPQNEREITLNITSTNGEDYTRVINTTVDGSAVYHTDTSCTPKIMTVVASAVGNSTATATSVLDYYDPKPVRMNLIGIPSTMPSADVSGNVSGMLLAKVTDEKGRGVPNQLVNFTIIHPVYPAYQESPPYLEDHLNQTSNTTNSEGITTVKFRPGTLNTTLMPNGSISAEVIADWGIQTDNVTMTWKNFPYLSVYTSVNNATAGVNQTFDVLVQVRGEGAPIIYREPMDVVLATQRAWSMMEEDTDRMQFAFNAEHLFIDKLIQAKPMPGKSDNVEIKTSGGNPHGIVNMMDMWKNFLVYAGDDNNNPSDDDSTYVSKNYIGNGQMSYFDWVQTEVPFTSNLEYLKSRINYTVPWDDKDYSQTPVNPVRRTLYESISELRETPNEIKAVVLLVDSDISDYGDPLADGQPKKKWEHMGGSTNSYYPFEGPAGENWDPDVEDEPRQNMGYYANEYGVKIFVVYAASTTNTADETTYQTLASMSGGDYYRAQNATDLARIYEEIAEKLLTEASIDTIMNIDMGVVTVNAVPWSQEINGSILKYVYQPGLSTTINSYWAANNTTIFTDTNYDQTNDYCNATTCDYTLTFIVGTINIGQIWEARYRLESLIEGDINIFGNESVINFTHPLFQDTVSYSLGELYITILPNTTLETKTEDLEIQSFTIKDKSGNTCTNNCEVKGSGDLSWVISYTGNKTVTQKLYIRSSSGGKWRQFDNIKTQNESHIIADTLTVSLNDLTGGNYQIMLEAYAPDSPKRSSIISIAVAKSRYSILLK